MYVSVRQAALAAIISLSAPTSAGEWLLGLGADDLEQDERTLGLGLEVRADPLFQRGVFSLTAGAAAETDLDGDVWAGAGPVAALSRGAGRIGLSVMPGLYAEGGGNDLGGSFQIRSQFFVDWGISERARIGLAFGHKSNADTNGSNPGVETLLLTYGRSF